MTYTDAERYIHSFTRFGSQLGLERMRKLLKFMGDPQDSLRFIHIAGTNGKGSIAKMSASVLKESGYTVGMYTSPFVVDFRERFQVNGRMIEKSEFVELVEFIDPFVKKLAAEGSQVTEFEAVTAIGFEYFYRKHCDIVALEVGLGGRFDATNVIKTPECAVITSISLDHIDILGDTIEKIAFEKAGIIKESTDLVTYPMQELDVISVFMQKCAQTHSRFIQPNPNTVDILESGIQGSKFNFGGHIYQIKLAGMHQIYNAVSVIEAMKVLRKKGFDISDDSIYLGLKKSVFPARFEIMSKDPLIIVDGAHNRQAVESLGMTLDNLDSIPLIAIMGMMADKDCKSALESIGKRCKAIITVPVPFTPRAVDPCELADTARVYCKQVYTIMNYKEALYKAIGLTDGIGAVVVCGSFYMASGMRKIIKQAVSCGFSDDL